MVMKKSAMRKNLIQTILRSFGRYLAIVLIITLGAGMFVGLLMTKTDMVATGQKFADQQNMFDLRIISNFGWTQSHVDAVRQLDGIKDAEGLIYKDLIVHRGESTSDSVYRFYALPETVNCIDLRAGRMPENPNECLADGYHATEKVIGTTITMSDSNSEGSFSDMKAHSFTVVGYMATPLYMDMNRGTTSVGNGSLSGYFYVPREAFDIDYYSEINITVPENYALYSDEYYDAMETLADRIEPDLIPMVDERRQIVRDEAEESYRDGICEFAEGLWEYHSEKYKATEELSAAHEKLLDGEKAIVDNEKLIADGEKQIESAKKQLSQAASALASQKTQLAASKETALQSLDEREQRTHDQIDETESRISDLNEQIQHIDDQLAQLDDEMGGVRTELLQIDGEIYAARGSISAVDANIRAQETLKRGLQLMPGDNSALLEQVDSTISALQEERNRLELRIQTLQEERQSIQEQFNVPLSQYNKLDAEKNSLQTQRAMLQMNTASLDAELQSIASGRDMLEQQFASAEEELQSAQDQLSSGWGQLLAKEKELADGKKSLEEAKIEIADGWVSYEDGMAEAEAEFAEAEVELSDARIKLSDARNVIDSMTDNKVFLLSRSSNLGYNSLSSSSDIVAGVSRVFPAFFLLVASLVCITTMTRMIDEERTQIGTLKALGYSNKEIITKYMVYAGSGAVLGCGIGVTLGSVIFPTILWQAYRIMLYITDDIVLKFNLPLCLIVVGTYVAVMLFVTWYCCKRTLREEPAELIRPRAPDAGKKVFLEYFPIWQKISFLNKVTIRNIFRYRQRLAMMIVGIGGCTALLLTGFGLRDSIVNVVDYQFKEVTTYDMSVYFADGQTKEEQAEFLQRVRPFSKNAMFYYQTSVELDYDNRVKEIYLIAAESQVKDFIDLHSGGKSLDLPSDNEVVLSVGAAEAMKIHVGDQVVLRNADMQTLELTVSGIYDNHVYNYAIVSPQGLELQWGEKPENQMAFIKMKDGKDAHAASAEISGMADVMNISVSEDLADMVGSMMEALDLVVWVIVFCAGLLAIVVLYNLTNININERIREIATIKVLGFNAAETGAYVFKENMALTVIGSIIGLGMGYFLLLFVMSQVKIDMVWFKALATPLSYILSVLLTLLSACVVDFIFYFNLEKINMAEALKSVE